MKYTIFNKKNGIIQRVIDCQDISIQLKDDESAVIGSYPDDRFYYDNGMVEIEPKPSENHRFDFEKKQWVEMPDLKVENIRILRNRLLSESDWTQVPDSPLSTEKKAEWAKYRQALRDITNQDPNFVVFPDKP